MKLRSIPSSFALVPTTLEEAVVPHRVATHNTDVIKQGEPLFQMDFDYIHYDEAGQRTPKVMSTQFLEKGKHCIITLPGSYTPICTNVHLQEYIENLHTLREQSGIDKLVVVAKDSADNMYEWLMGAVRRASWFNPALHDKANILEKLGIVCISDKSVRLINALGFAVNNPRLGITTKRGLIIAADGLALAVQFEEDARLCDRVKVSVATQLASLTANMKKLVIVGGGMIGAMEAYFAYQEAKKNNTQVRVTIYDKNHDVKETTVSNIVPSLTPDEILSVVPRGNLLVEKLGYLFSQPGGIRVDDVPGVNDSITAKAFIEQVELYGLDELGHKKRTETLLKMGKVSMDLWQRIYDEAEPEFREILEMSNFNPCREPRKNHHTLHDGYRIDLINVTNAKTKAEEMQADYVGLGYKNCHLLSPEQVKELDPFLADFCDSNSTVDSAGVAKWKSNAAALYRPGGCLDAEVFLPKLYKYLEKKMGTYVGNDGQQKSCFKIKYDSKVNGIVYSSVDSGNQVITGLKVNDTVKNEKRRYSKTEYAICPGEKVGTISELGLSEPAYAGFAGASLVLNIPIPAEKLEMYSKFNHCMEVHQEGVVLAWQGRFRDNKIFIGVAGTKAFYSDKKPHITEDFAKDRNVLQLNMIKSVLPEFVSLAFGRDVSNVELTENDLLELVSKKIAKRWVGTRAVAYDGFPTLGKVYHAGREVENARCTTHLGSGGASFAPAAVMFSRSALELDKLTTPKSMLQEQEDIKEDVLAFGNSARKLAKIHK